MLIRKPYIYNFRYKIKNVCNFVYINKIFLFLLLLLPGDMFYYLYDIGWWAASHWKTYLEKTCALQYRDIITNWHQWNLRSRHQLVLLNSANKKAIIAKCSKLKWFIIQQNVRAYYQRLGAKGRVAKTDGHHRSCRVIKWSICVNGRLLWTRNGHNFMSYMTSVYNQALVIIFLP